MTAGNIAIVRRLFDAFNAGDVAAASLLFSDAYLRHGSGGQDLNGLEEWRSMVRAYRAAFPDVVTEIDKVVAQNDYVTTLWTSRGTHRGSLTGEHPTGANVIIRGVLLSRIEKGRIAEEWEYYEELKLFSTIGIIPTLAETRD